MEKKEVNMAIQDVILDFFQKSIKSDGSSDSKLIVGQLTAEGKAYLSRISGLDFKKYVDVALSSSDFRHTYNDHYGSNEKDKGNNNPLTDEDIKSIAAVISKPDYVLFLGYDVRRQSNKFAFLKASVNGTYNLMEVCGSKGGSLTAKTFFNTKKEILQQILELQNKLKHLLSGKRISYSESVKQSSLFSTSETYSDVSLSPVKVPTLVDFGNSYTTKIIQDFEKSKLFTAL